MEESHLRKWRRGRPVKTVTVRDTRLSLVHAVKDTVVRPIWSPVFRWESKTERT